MVRRIDGIDQNILRELQEDGRITNVELSKRVGISAPPCLRRVRSLEEDGIIRGYRALLDEKKLGFDLMAFAMVHLVSQAEADLSAFSEQVQRWPLVRSCWMLSGEVDFLLLCVAPDLQNLPEFRAGTDRRAQCAQCEDGADPQAGQGRAGGADGRGAAGLSGLPGTLCDIRPCLRTERSKIASGSQT